jgi:hypothetical protein
MNRVRDTRVPDFPKPRVILNGEIHEGRNLTPEEFAPYHEGFIQNRAMDGSDPEAQRVAFGFYSALELPTCCRLHRDAILQIIPELVKHQMAINSDDPLPSLWRDQLLARDPEFAYNLDELAGLETAH